MKLISKEESIKLLGRKKMIFGFETSFGINSSIDSVPIFYLGGIREIDDDIASRQVEYKNQLSNINAYPNGFEIEIHTMPTNSGHWTKKYRVPFFLNQVLKWTIEKQDSVYEQQSKSVLGRAVLGGLLFGGAGAIVGALTGTKGERIKVNFVDYILTLVIEYEGVERAIILGFPDRMIKYVRDFFEKNFPNKFTEPNDFNINLKNSTKPLSIANELRKFKELLDNNVITQEEFEKQKDKLLSE